MTTTSLLPDVGIELREGYAEVGDQSLHYVEAGDGPLIVLLHGFPEFWFGWRLQIAPLAAAGFRVVAPDTRGYNLSSKPEGFEAYAVDLLAADIRGLIGELGAESALLVGHDWGGTIAWTIAMNHPEVVDRLAILNAAHPRRLQEGLHHPSQLRKSWYFFFFAAPGLPEEVVHARDWHFFRHFLHDANPPYTPQEIERYVEAWSQPGAAAGMINYYRASVRQSQKEAAAKLRPISAPTLVIWGERDSYLGSELAEPDRDDVPNLDRVERLPDASHWVHHDEAERVNQLLIDFFAGIGATQKPEPERNVKKDRGSPHPCDFHGRSGLVGLEPTALGSNSNRRGGTHDGEERSRRDDRGSPLDRRNGVGGRGRAIDARKDIGSLPITDDEKLVGMITDRDITTRVVAEAADLKATSVGDVYSRDLISVEPDKDLQEALQLMARHQVRRLPVVENDRLVGIVAQADIALRENETKTGELVEAISEPSGGRRAA